MRAKGKKFVSLFLVFSLLALSGNLMANERRGAELVIQKVDGQQIRGELIAVKKNSLLLLNSEGADVSVDIEDIKVIKIVKKSKFWTGAGIGFLVVTVPFTVLHIKEYGGTSSFGLIWLVPVWGAIIGGIPGAIVGGLTGIDKTIQIEGKSYSEIKQVLEKLRSKARVPDYQ